MLLHSMRFAVLLAVVTGLLGCYSAPNPPSPYYGPNDAVPGATAWWGLRAFGSAEIGAPIADVRCVTAATTVTISSLGNGNFDVATLTAKCPSDTYFVSKLYDQTGNGYSLVQATLAQQPQLILNCQASLPCLSFTAASSQTLVATLPSPWIFYSLIAMASTSQASPDAIILGNSLPASLGFSSSASNLVATMNGGAEIVSTPISLNAFHALQASFQQASSAIYVDGVETAGNAGTNSYPAGTIALGSDGAANFLQGQVTEAGIWPGIFVPGIAGLITNDENAYWQF